ELITDNELNVTWHGALRILDAGVLVEADISLDVTYDGTAGEISGFFANVNGSGGPKDFYIDADFSNKGVIITSSSNIYYGDLNDDSATFSAKNGQLSGIIGQEGAIGVFISNDVEDLYTGGFVVSGVCSEDIFDSGCSLSTDVPAQTAFCLNATDNGGRNIFNTGCNEEGAEMHGATDVLKGLRDTACLARGDMADDTCKSRAEVRRVCNLNRFMQTTGLIPNEPLCTGSTADSGGVTYDSLRMACETADAGSFDTSCDDGDIAGSDVETARDNACLTASENNAPHNDCLTRANVVSTCTTDPFTQAGCANVGTITTLRRDYCFADATLWNDRCDAGEAGYADVTEKRDNACLDAAGAAPDTDCATRTNVVSTCTTDPFTRTGCANVGTIATLRRNYCFADATLWNDRCDAGEAGYADVTAKRDNA
ncbi:MAG: hypothetical protein K8953_02440, partial [Proteobacteria bacterium]|nr:hypothetical protein [Pseudomonadota bacterium]